jgi:hypothetical protein
MPGCLAQTPNGLGDRRHPIRVGLLVLNRVAAHDTANARWLDGWIVKPGDCPGQGGGVAECHRGDLAQVGR